MVNIYISKQILKCYGFSESPTVGILDLQRDRGFEMLLSTFKIRDAMYTQTSFGHYSEFNWFEGGSTTDREAVARAAIAFSVMISTCHLPCTTY